MRKLKQTRVRIRQEIDHNPDHYEKFTGAHWVVEGRSMLTNNWFPVYVETSPALARHICPPGFRVVHRGRVVYQP